MHMEPLVQCLVVHSRCSPDVSRGWGGSQLALFAWALGAWWHMVGSRKCLLITGASAELGLLPSSLRKHCENDNIYSPTTFTENPENTGGTLGEGKVSTHMGSVCLFSLPGCTVLSQLTVNTPAAVFFSVCECNYL